MTEHDPNRPPPAPTPTSDDAPTVAWTRPTDRPVDDLTPPPPTAEPVRTAPGPNRLRWGIALLVTVLVVAVGAAAVVLLTGQSAPSSIAGYAPEGSTVYGEVRLDFPGDQKQQLGDFLSKFPGFQDQSTLDAKIDDVLDRLVRSMSDDRQSWTTNIKPWFGGQMGFAVAQLPSPDGSGEPRGLAILSVTDAAKARAWFDEVTTDLTSTEATHNGVQLVVFGEGDESGAMAIHNDKTMLVGDEASVRAAIDSGGKTAFASDGAYKQALDALEGEGLGYVFVDLEAYMTWLEDAAESMPGASAVPIPPMMAELTPDWMLFRLRAQGDALAMEAVVPHVEAASTGSENRASVLAGHVPPSTLLFMDGHDAGAAILKGIELAKQDPDAAAQIKAFEEQVALIGGLDGLIGWWGDAAVVVAGDGGTGVHGGVLVQPKDRADAERLLGVLKAGLQLGGAGSGMSVREEDHNGTTITVFDFGDAATLGQIFGQAAGLPPGTELPEGERAELAIAVTDDVVVLSVGSGFAKAVLDAGAADSLADDAGYQAHIGKVGADNTGSIYVDLAGLREVIERLAASSPDALAAYERDVKPYLLPLDALVQATRRDGELDRTISLITVTEAQ
jgi:hypothetical protein